jgi:hypothetical protein
VEYNEAAKRGQELEAENSAAAVTAEEAVTEAVTETVTESSPTVTVTETKGVKADKK